MTTTTKNISSDELEEKIRQAALKREIELAAFMQKMLLPVSLPDNEFIEVHATYLPHAEVGGDYYDCIQLSNDEYIFCMADVSGKGIAAAMLMSNFQAAFRALLPRINTFSELIKTLNEIVFSNAKGEKFITFFIVRFNTKTKELRYVNAGHNPPLLVHDKVVYLLNDGCTGLGMFEKISQVNEGKIFAPDNALLHFYTDGVPETENDAGKEFGMERLQQFLVSQLRVSNIETLHKLLVDELNNFRQSRSFTDDITLLTCRFKGKM